VIKIRRIRYGVTLDGVVVLIVMGEIGDVIVTINER
jgi:hypothetical protein